MLSSSCTNINQHALISFGENIVRKRVKKGEAKEAIVDKKGLSNLMQDYEELQKSFHRAGKVCKDAFWTQNKNIHTSMITSKMNKNFPKRYVTDGLRCKMNNTKWWTYLHMICDLIVRAVFTYAWILCFIPPLAGSACAPFMIMYIRTGHMITDILELPTRDYFLIILLHQKIKRKK